MVQSYLKLLATCLAALQCCTAENELKCADSSSQCASVDTDILSTWQPWDDGDRSVELGNVYANDGASDVDCTKVFVEVTKELSGSSRVPISTGLETVLPGNDLVYIALNGKNEGILVKVLRDDAKEECLGTLAQVAVNSLVTKASSVLFEPKRLLTNTGRSIKAWKDIEQSDKYIHVLLDREIWVWPGIREGFSFRLAGFTLTTVVLKPRVILVDDLFSEDDAKSLIESSSKNLFRSPEKHYSTDSKFHNYRTSETGHVSERDPIARALQFNGWQVLRLPIREMMEPLQLLRYTPGKWYKEHYDVFHNVEPLDVVDDNSLLQLIPEKIAEWALEQRYLLWRATQENFSHASALPEPARRVSQLHFRPSDPRYPDLVNSPFLDKLAAGLEYVNTQAMFDAAETLTKSTLQASWEQSILCDGDEACVAAVRKIFEVLAADNPIDEMPPLNVFMRNRFVTMLPYLSKVQVGGETVFPYSHGRGLFGNGAGTISHEGMPECSRGAFVPPKVGSAAVFYHVEADGTSIDRLSMHGGCPPKEGIKYAMNMFCWSLPWQKGLELTR